MYISTFESGRLFFEGISESVDDMLKVKTLIDFVSTSG